jgi:hypothetical protein
MFPAAWHAGKFPFSKKDLKDDLISGTEPLSCPTFIAYVFT